jgi:phage-related protein
MAKFFEPLINAAKAVWDWLDENVFSPIANAIAYVVGYAYQKFTEIKNKLVEIMSVVIGKVIEIVAKIAEIFSALLWAFNEYVWNPIRQKVIAFYNEYLAPIVEKIRSVINTVKGYVLEVWSWIKEKIIDKVLEWVDVLTEKIKSVGVKVVNFLSDTFKTVINGVLWAIENSINLFIKMLNGAIGVINKIPGVNITTVSEVKIPRLAQGAVIPANKEFLAVLGDQKNGRNLEGPESLFRQIVREESGANNSTPFIIQLVLNGKVIGEEAVQYVNGVIRKTGKSPIKQGG